MLQEQRQQGACHRREFAKVRKIGLLPQPIAGES
jgi:hypothetical protein